MSANTADRNINARTAEEAKSASIIVSEQLANPAMEAKYVHITEFALVARNAVEVKYASIAD